MNAFSEHRAGTCQGDYGFEQMYLALIVAQRVRFLRR
jgi:hypothetical protein